MNDDRLDQLYTLLPAIYRMRDEERGGPLRALLQVIAEQVNVVEDDIKQLYENWFIETCQEWVTTYIGDLIDYRPVRPAGEPGDVKTAQVRARNKILVPRRNVANTLHNRRRKGTLHCSDYWPATWPIGRRGSSSSTSCSAGPNTSIICAWNAGAPPTCATATPWRKSMVRLTPWRIPSMCAASTRRILRAATTFQVSAYSSGDSDLLLLERIISSGPLS